MNVVKKKKKKRVPDILKKTGWDDCAALLSDTEPAYTCLINQRVCSCVGRHHMGEIKLSPIWGYVLNSLSQPGSRGGRG